MTSALTSTGSTREWRRIRAQYEAALNLLGELPCGRGTGTIRPGDNWDLGHRIDRALGGTDTDGLWPEHATRTPGCCEGNRNAGARLGNQLRRSSGTTPTREHAGLAASLSPGRERAYVDDGVPVFDPTSLEGVPWLADLLEKPDDAAWPRHMSPVHPEAVGTYGLDLEKWIEETQGVSMRWWQRLAGRMQLQHRADGSLCVATVVESGPRRIGKSVRLRSNATWRMQHGAGLFGERQLVLHTGRDLAIVREIQQNVWRWAEEIAGWRVARANGKEAIENQAGDRWLARALSAVYGYDVTLGMVDEGWDVPPAAIEEGLEPAAMERQSAQIVLTSTAHRKATPLMPRAISSALAGMGEEHETLLLLWAADPRAAPGAESTWRSASPHWSEDRRKLIASKYEKALRGEVDPAAEDPDPMEGFRAQYLNIWPAKTVRVPGDPVVDGDEWAGRGGYVPGKGRTVVAVESWYASGVSVAVAEVLDDGRVGVRVEGFENVPAAAARVAELTPGVLLAGKSLLRDPAFTAAEGQQGRARQAVEDFRRLVDDGVLVHDGSPLLAEQVEDVRVARGTDGLRIVSKGRVDAIKAATWAAQRARDMPAPAPAIF
jgi:hypothetical protein